MSLACSRLYPGQGQEVRNTLHNNEGALRCRNMPRLRLADCREACLGEVAFGGRRVRCIGS